MPFFICVPALMLLVTLTTIASVINYCSKDSTSPWSYERTTTMDKVYVYIHMIILSFFI